MAGNETFCFKWYDFHNSFNLGFKDIRMEHDLFDVTLVSDDNQEIEAHKLILSACSSFFKNILKIRKHQHPLIYIKGTDSHELSAVLDFMYHGEVNIEQKNLDKFLAAASDLQIKGLTRETVGEQMSSLYNNSQKSVLQSESHSSSKLLQSSNSSPNDALQLQSHSSSNLLQSSNIQSYEEISKVGIEVIKMDNFDDLASSTDGHEYQDIADQENKQEELIRFENGEWICNFCGKTDRNKVNLKSHVQIHTDTSGQYCSYCGKNFKNKNSLRVHKYRSHAKEKIIEKLGAVV